MTTNLDCPSIELPKIRPSRLRQSGVMRSMVREHHVRVDDLVLPLFIREGEGIHNPIQSMPGHAQLSIDQLDAELSVIKSLKIPAVILFGIPIEKDPQGSSSLTEQSVIAQAVQYIKSVMPELLVMVDVCLCEYTSHGHCGVLDRTDHVDNDATLGLLVKQSLVLVKAGADVIAPSGMMDGMVGAIRQGLDHAGYQRVPILSYAVKYASAFYGPFREAAEGAPQFGDRRTYQMDPANAAEGLREAELDVAQGADMLMVKPAQVYLDMVCRVKQAFPGIPLAAYQVSGEFAMIKAAAQNGWLDEKTAMMESLLSIKRAGADFIITYFAKQAAKYILSSHQ